MANAVNVKKDEFQIKLTNNGKITNQVQTIKMSGTDNLISSKYWEIDTISKSFSIKDEAKIDATISANLQNLGIDISQPVSVDNIKINANQNIEITMTASNNNKLSFKLTPVGIELRETKSSLTKSTLKAKIFETKENKGQKEIIDITLPSNFSTVLTSNYVEMTSFPTQMWKYFEEEAKNNNAFDFISEGNVRVLKIDNRLYLNQGNSFKQISGIFHTNEIPTSSDHNIVFNLLDGKNKAFSAQITDNAKLQQIIDFIPNCQYDNKPIKQYTYTTLSGLKSGNKTNGAKALPRLDNIKKAIGLENSNQTGLNQTQINNFTNIFNQQINSLRLQINNIPDKSDREAFFNKNIKPLFDNLKDKIGSLDEKVDSGFKAFKEKFDSYDKFFKLTAEEIGKLGDAIEELSKNSVTKDYANDLYNDLLTVMNVINDNINAKYTRSEKNAEIRFNKLSEEHKSIKKEIAELRKEFSDLTGLFKDDQGRSIKLSDIQNVLSLILKNQGQDKESVENLIKKYGQTTIDNQSKINENFKTISNKITAIEKELSLLNTSNTNIYNVVKKLDEQGIEFSKEAKDEITNILEKKLEENFKSNNIDLKIFTQNLAAAITGNQNILLNKIDENKKFSDYKFKTIIEKCNKVLDKQDESKTDLKLKTTTLWKLFKQEIHKTEFSKEERNDFLNAIAEQLLSKEELEQITVEQTKALTDEIQKISTNLTNEKDNLLNGVTHNYHGNVTINNYYGNEKGGKRGDDNVRNIIDPITEVNPDKNKTIKVNQAVVTETNEENKGVVTQTNEDNVEYKNENKDENTAIENNVEATKTSANSENKKKRSGWKKLALFVLLPIAVISAVAIPVLGAIPAAVGILGGATSIFAGTATIAVTAAALSLAINSQVNKTTVKGKLETAKTKIKEKLEGKDLEGLQIDLESHKDKLKEQDLDIPLNIIKNNKIKDSKFNKYRKERMKGLKGKEGYNKAKRKNKKKQRKLMDKNLFKQKLAMQAYIDFCKKGKTSVKPSKYITKEDIELMKEYAVLKKAEKALEKQEKSFKAKRAKKQSTTNEKAIEKEEEKKLTEEKIKSIVHEALNTKPLSKKEIKQKKIDEKKLEENFNKVYYAFLKKNEITNLDEESNKQLRSEILTSVLNNKIDKEDLTDEQINYIISEVKKSIDEKLKNNEGIEK